MYLKYYNYLRTYSQCHVVMLFADLLSNVDVMNVELVHAMILVVIATWHMHADCGVARVNLADLLPHYTLIILIFITRACRDALEVPGLSCSARHGPKVILCTP